MKKFLKIIWNKLFCKDIDKKLFKFNILDENILKNYGNDFDWYLTCIIDDGKQPEGIISMNLIRGNNLEIIFWKSYFLKKDLKKTLIGFFKKRKIEIL